MVGMHGVKYFSMCFATSLAFPRSNCDTIQFPRHRLGSHTVPPFMQHEPHDKVVVYVGLLRLVLPSLPSDLLQLPDKPSRHCRHPIQVRRPSPLRCNVPSIGIYHAEAVGQITHCRTVVYSHATDAHADRRGTIIYRIRCRQYYS